MESSNISKVITIVTKGQGIGPMEPNEQLGIEEVALFGILGLGI
jgi:hypothetical protein